MQFTPRRKLIRAHTCECITVLHIYMYRVELTDVTFINTAMFVGSQTICDVCACSMIAKTHFGSEKNH